MKYVLRELVVISQGIRRIGSTSMMLRTGHNLALLTNSVARRTHDVAQADKAAWPAIRYDCQRFTHNRHRRNQTVSLSYDSSLRLKP